MITRSKKTQTSLTKEGLVRLSRFIKGIQCAPTSIKFHVSKLESFKPIIISSSGLKERSPKIRQMQVGHVNITLKRIVNNQVESLLMFQTRPNWHGKWHIIRYETTHAKQDNPKNIWYTAQAIESLILKTWKPINVMEDDPVHYARVDIHLVASLNRYDNQFNVEELQAQVSLLNPDRNTRLIRFEHPKLCKIEARAFELWDDENLCCAVCLDTGFLESDEND